MRRTIRRPSSNDAGRALRAARFSGAVTVDDAALREIVRRHLEIDAVARQDLDPVAPQPSGDVGQDRLPVFQLDGERRAREDLLDRAEELERRLFGRLFGRLRRSRGVEGSAGYENTLFRDVISLPV